MQSILNAGNRWHVCTRLQVGWPQNGDVCKEESERAREAQPPALFRLDGLLSPLV